MTKQILIILLIITVKSSSQNLIRFDTLYSYKVINKIENNSVTEVMGQLSEIKNEFVSTSLFKLFSPEQNLITVKSAIKRINGKIETSGFDQAFDTNDNKGLFGDKTFSKFLNKEKIQYFDYKGKYIDSLTSGKPKNNKELEQFGLDESDMTILNKNFLNKTNLLLNKTWNDTTIIDGKSISNEVTTFTVTETNDSIIKIKYNSVEVFDKIIFRMNKEMKMIGTKKSNGMYEIDNLSNIIISKKYKSIINAEVNYSDIQYSLNTVLNGELLVLRIN